ncbi:hypothetical protein TNCV_2118751 [Trichonephila clavipes]|nr:hypothetical protein TNCV_2118751 [Trichonephila clavipes]
MAPNTLEIHTEYVLVKSVGSKVLWVVAAETMGAGIWRIGPSPAVPCLNGGGGNGGVAIYRKEVQHVSGSGHFHSFPSGRTRQQQHVLTIQAISTREL